MKPEEIKDKLEAKVGAVEYVAGPGDAAVIVPADKWHDAARFLCDEPSVSLKFLRSLCGVDRLQAGHIEVVAHLFDYGHKHGIVLKTKVARAGGSLPTVSDVWPAAEWHEREVFDLFGVTVEGHRDLRRLLLPDDWVGHPLLKDYKEPESYDGIPMQRPVAGGAPVLTTESK